MSAGVVRRRRDVGQGATEPKAGCPSKRCRAGRTDGAPAVPTAVAPPRRAATSHPNRRASPAGAGIAAPVCTGHRARISVRTAQPALSPSSARSFHVKPASSSAHDGSCESPTAGNRGSLPVTTIRSYHVSRHGSSAAISSYQRCPLPGGRSTADTPTPAVAFKDGPGHLCQLGGGDQHRPSEGCGAGGVARGSSPGWRSPPPRMGRPLEGASASVRARNPTADVNTSRCPTGRLGGRPTLVHRRCPGWPERGRRPWRPGRAGQPVARPATGGRPGLAGGPIRTTLRRLGRCCSGAPDPFVSRETVGGRRAQQIAAGVGAGGAATRASSGFEPAARRRPVPLRSDRGPPRRPTPSTGY